MRELLVHGEKEMDNSYSGEHSNYTPPNQLYAETKSTASYEEIFSPPKFDGKEHSYISFSDALSSRFCFENNIPKKTHYNLKKFTFSIPSYILIILFTIIGFSCVILILFVLDIIHITNPWKNTVVPEVFPYQGEEWFVREEQWGMKHTYKNCPQFKIVTKVTITQIKLEDQSCNDIKACERYLTAYDTNVTVRHNGELEYEFFFGNDKHVFEGRNWKCFYKPGELRLGYLGEKYDPEDLGPAWGNIRYTIIQYGIKNNLVSENVCYNIDPDKRKCN